MTADHILSGAQAAQDLASALLTAAGGVMTTHGNDPNSLAILTAGFAMAVKRIEEGIDPKFGARLSTQLATHS